MQKLEVLVIGATGVLGGAVADALLQEGHVVRALTRDPSSPAAEALHMRGANLCWADLDDQVAMRAAVEGVDAVFLVTSTSQGAATETRQGLAVIEFARHCDVPQVVYSSAMPATRLSGVPLHDSKHEIEQYLRASGVAHTVVCPGFLMENLLQDPWARAIAQGQLPLPFNPRRRLQSIAADDFGRFVRIVLRRPEEFYGRRICIASDENSPIEMSAALARAIGRPISHVEPAPDLDFPGPWSRQVFDRVARHRGTASIPLLRSRYPEVDWQTLDDWARRQAW